MIKQELLSARVNPPALAPQINRRAIVDLDTFRFRVRSEVVHPSGDVVVDVQAFDGAQETSYVPAAGRGFIAKKHREDMDVYQFVPLLTDALLLPPRSDGNGINDASLISVLRSEFATLRPELEEVRGRKCYVIDVGDESIKGMTLWIDADAGALPLRYVDYKRPDAEGKQAVLSDRELVEVRKFADGRGADVWLPISAACVTNSPDWTTRRTVEMDASSLRLNFRVADGDFRVPFPQHANIVDKESGESFVEQLADEMGDPIWTTADVVLAPIAPLGKILPESTAAPLARARPLTRRWTNWMTLGSLFLGALTIYLVWSFARRNQVSP